MSAEPRGRRLGRGLSALLGEEAAELAAEQRPGPGHELPIELLRPSPLQPRRRFDDEDIESLAESIRENGVLQPILVRPAADGGDGGEVYDIVAGERRWRAAQRAALHLVPVVVRELSDRDALQISLVENIQRRDLAALEEAEGFQRLIAEFGHTQEKLARALGKSRSHVANTLRLLGLPSAVKALLDEGKLTAGHGRALLGSAEPEAHARLIVARGLNVRQAERLAVGGAQAKRRARRPEKDADTAALETDLCNTLGLKVEIDHRKAGGGVVKLHYRSLEQLDEVCRRLHLHGKPWDV